MQYSLPDGDGTGGSVERNLIPYAVCQMNQNLWHPFTSDFICRRLTASSAIRTSTTCVTQLTALVGHVCKRKAVWWPLARCSRHKVLGMLVY